MNTDILLNPPAGRSERATGTTMRKIPSGDLFQSKQEVVIRHDGQEYRLRITRQNKLILTK